MFPLSASYSETIQGLFRGNRSFCSLPLTCLKSFLIVWKSHRAPGYPRNSPALPTPQPPAIHLLIHPLFPGCSRYNSENTYPAEGDRMISLGEATGQGLGGCQLRARELMGTLQIHKRLSVMLGPRRACCITSWLDFGPLNPQRSRDRLLKLSSDLHEHAAACTCAPHHTHTEKARKKGDTGRGLGKQWQSRERQRRGERQNRRKWYLLGQRQSQAEDPKGTSLFPAIKETQPTLWDLLP